MERPDFLVVRAAPAASTKPEAPKRCSGERGALDLRLLGAEAAMAGSAVGMLIGDAVRRVRDRDAGRLGSPSVRAAVIGACTAGGAAVGAVAQAFIR